MHVRADAARKHPMPSRRGLVHSFAESSVKSQLQKSLELNLPSTSSLACQETLDHRVRILTERVMDTLCESAAAAPCPGEDLGELSPAAVIIDAWTVSTSAGETRKPKEGWKWWSLPKKIKPFKNKVGYLCISLYRAELIVYPMGTE